MTAGDAFAALHLQNANFVAGELARSLTEIAPAGDAGRRLGAEIGRQAARIVLTMRAVDGASRNDIVTSDVESLDPDQVFATILRSV